MGRFLKLFASRSFTILLFHLGLFYFVVLFILARWVEGNTIASRKISGSPITYGLSIALFCTSRTFYGSVGKAASSGMLYSTVYIGPTITFILLWQVMRRTVRIKQRYRLLTGYALINRDFADELTGVVVDVVGRNAA
ncbi:SLC5/6 family protein [Pseudodesulfovibrio portus]|uniref:Uncharacterized protein n=1 Tax=Pseudodesulfovibrio portus TaxID=231439 RepID=A0ABN6RUQ6_9BACT|nr:hypothetical protein [Pseudodesulfovibrio portus]BDQ34439.1 hypothetical protein JCM14722_19810 [Pseudodesulfovibrio portus]